MDREALSAMVWAATFSREVSMRSKPDRATIASQAAWVAAQAVAALDTLDDKHLPLTIPKPEEPSHG